MYWLELQDLCFLLKCFRDPHDNMNIREYVSFSSGNTRAAAGNKLTHNFCKTSMARHFYFNRVVRLWNSLPNSCIDLTVSVESNKHSLLKYFWEHFNANFDPTNHCSFHIVCPCSRCFLQLTCYYLVECFDVCIYMLNYYVSCSFSGVSPSDCHLYPQIHVTTTIHSCTFTSYSL